MFAAARGNGSGPVFAPSSARTKKVYDAITRYSAVRQVAHRVVPARKPDGIIVESATVELIVGLPRQAGQKSGVVSSGQRQHPSVTTDTLDKRIRTYRRPQRPQLLKIDGAFQRVPHVCG